MALGIRAGFRFKNQDSYHQLGPQAVYPTFWLALDKNGHSSRANLVRRGNKVMQTVNGSEVNEFPDWKAEPRHQNTSWNLTCMASHTSRIKTM